MEFSLPPNQAESIRRPSTVYRASTYSGYASSTNSSTQSLRSSMRSSAASTKSNKSVRFHETREIVVNPEPELSWNAPSDTQAAPVNLATRGRPQLMRTKWSMPNLGSKSDDSAAQSKPKTAGVEASQADFEAWLARTAMMGRVEGFGKDERRQDSKTSDVSRRVSPQKASVETKKCKRKSWIGRLSVV